MLEKTMTDFYAWCEYIRQNEQKNAHVIAFRCLKQHDQHCYDRLYDYIKRYRAFDETDSRRAALVLEYKAASEARDAP